MRSLGANKSSALLPEEALIYEEIFAYLGALQLVDPDIVPQFKETIRDHFHEKISTKLRGRDEVTKKRRRECKRIVTATLTYFFKQWVEKPAVFAIFSLYTLVSNFTNNWSESTNRIMSSSLDGVNLNLSDYLEQMK